MALLRSIFRNWRTDIGPAASQAEDDAPTEAVIAVEARSWAAEPPPSPIPVESRPEPTVVQQIEMLPQGKRRVTWVGTICTPGGGQLELHPQEVILAADEAWPSEPAPPSALPN
ncbi:hypothetical protein GCM10009422_13220 [Brevundimonas kwangchunensis]|uniref:Uncharacterized protein n=1 Tax=Brevundimonas kwangchunensis TaxID=322163 RepID=A0ABN1GTI4_9CAUL